jgi:hypothetical protein
MASGAHSTLSLLSNGYREFFHRVGVREVSGTWNYTSLINLHVVMLC